MNNSPGSMDNVIYTYMGFGSAAVISNLLVLIVLFSNFPLLKKSAFLVGLAIADIIDGSGLLSNGAVRFVRTLNGTSSLSVHPSYCMMIIVTPLLLLGNQIPGAMFLLVGIERLLAVACYQWYYAKWSNRLAWMLTLIAYAFSLLSVSVAFILAFMRKSTEKISVFCSLQLVVGNPYTYYNYIFSILGGIIAVSSTMLGLIIFKKRKKLAFSTTNVSVNMKRHVKNQWNLSKILLCLSFIDLSLVVVPNSLFVSLTNPTIRGWALQLICLRSVFNIFIYLIINSEFRAAAFRSVGISVFHTSVHQITSITVPQRASKL